MKQFNILVIEEKKTLSTVTHLSPKPIFLMEIPEVNTTPNNANFSL
jgi:hypothetical protein